MTDPYRISDQTPAPRHADPRAGLLRPALWLLLIVSAGANAVSSAIGLPVLIGIGFGLVTVACIATLVIHHYRHRNAAGG
jgi:hypothetical protein